MIKNKLSGIGWTLGITVKDADDNWLLVWQLDDEDSEIVRVRYLGPDPFA